MNHGRLEKYLFFKNKVKIAVVSVYANSCVDIKEEKKMLPVLFLTPSNQNQSQPH